MVHVNRKTSPPTVERKTHTHIHANGQINEWLIGSFGKQILTIGGQTFQTSLRQLYRLGSNTPLVSLAITSQYLSFLLTAYNHYQGTIFRCSTYTQMWSY